MDIIADKSPIKKIKQEKGFKTFKATFKTTLSFGCKSGKRIIAKNPIKCIKTIKKLIIKVEMGSDNFIAFPSLNAIKLLII